MIPETLRMKLESRVKQAVTPREASVDVMKELQAHYGWLSDEALASTAELLGLSTLQVEELATFYEMIFRRPVGRTVIHVCDSVSCWSMGGESLMQHLERVLAVRLGETTADNAITLLPCSCLGNCGDAPSIMIGEQLYGRVTPQQASQIVNQKLM
ncbi:MAG TPA: NADH-quinone oxidoreductase subunit NuoE [Desulfuromonadaceae bacterium]|jgi:NADH-quinone oxidoreductase subunit E